MKKTIAFLVAASLLFSAAGCSLSGGSDSSSGAALTSQSGQIEFSPSVPEEPSGERPSPDSSLPSSASSAAPSSVSSQPSSAGSSQASGASSSKSSSSSSSQPSSASSSQASSLSSSQSSSASASQPSSSSAPQAASDGEMRGVWISYLEYNTWLTGKTKAQFTSYINTAFDNVVSLGLNTVIVHVRHNGDAIYPSSVYPTSYLFSGTEGGDVPFDALQIMVGAAHDRGLSIEAWINPYRVRSSGTVKYALCGANPAKEWLSDGSGRAFSAAGGVFYNPASEDVRALIVSGVEEIVRNYDVDGIHFDDYFYPTTDASIDQSFYTAYRGGGGRLSLADWRRENVNTLVREVYSAVKAIDPSVSFGISPQGNNTANYDAQYADVAAWVSTAGYVDYIAPQIYFGFNHASAPFEATLAQYEAMIKVDSIRLVAGLAAYKIGTVDSKSAGAGRNEWVNHSDLLSRMVTAARKNSHSAGFILFRYDSIFSPAAGVASQVAAERSALASALQ